MGNSFDTIGVQDNALLVASRFDIYTHKYSIGDFVVFRNSMGSAFLNTGVIVDYIPGPQRYIIVGQGNSYEEANKNSLVARVIVPKLKLEDISILLSEYSKTKAEKKDAQCAEQVQYLTKEVFSLQNKLDQYKLNASPIADTNLKEYATSYIESAGWVTLNSSLLDLSFEYPVPHAAIISFAYTDGEDRDTDPSGQSYAWNLKNDDKSSSEYRYTYGIAGGVSATFKAGRSGWFTDFYELAEGSRENAIAVFKTNYGTEALLLATPMLFGLSEPDPNDKGTTIYANLPFKGFPEFKGIAIYVKNGLTEAEASRIVKSITIGGESH